MVLFGEGPSACTELADGHETRQITDHESNECVLMKYADLSRVVHVFRGSKVFKDFIEQMGYK